MQKERGILAELNKIALNGVHVFNSASQLAIKLMNDPSPEMQAAFDRLHEWDETIAATGRGDDEKLLSFLAEKLHDEMEGLDPRGSSWHLLPPHRREFFVGCVERILIELASLPLEPNGADK
jgi:hypothetical protein